MKGVEDWLHRILTVNFSNLQAGQDPLVTLIFLSESDMHLAAADLEILLPVTIDAVFHETKDPNRMRITFIDFEAGDVFTSRDEIVYYKPGFEAFRRTQSSDVLMTFGYWKDNKISWMDPEKVRPIHLRTIQFATYSED